MTLWLPPRWLRRFILWPIPSILVALYATTVPVLLIVAFVLSYRLPGKWRAVRSLGLATVYLFLEAAVTVVALVLWVASGFGWKLRSPAFVTAHYRVLQLTLQALVGAGRRLFELDIRTEGNESPNDQLPIADGPLVVMSRHAGPADSILLMHEVMTGRSRRPRIVAKDLLQIDPAMDILLNRLPNRFISPNPSESGGSSATVDAIASLAADMTADDAFVIFPEGGNFTEVRRVRAIDRLRSDGYLAAAERAEQLRNVLPPRPAGTMAALEAAPNASPVFVAHTGLDQIATIGDMWTAIPQDKTLLLHWHAVDPAYVPPTREEREEKLFMAWELIDRWVEANRDK